MDTHPKEMLLLERAHHWERVKPDSVWLTQPMGDGVIRQLSWSQALDEARRMAAYLKGLGFPPGSHIALLSKNCAHWLLADLAIWMAGHVSVPIYPTLAAGSVRYVLEHSESRLLFVGKLDLWEEMKAGVPEGLPTIALPLAPSGIERDWPAIVDDTDPLRESVVRQGEELATIIYTSGSTGQPKGVMMTFAAMAGSACALGRVIGSSEQDRMLSYLPLAHALERLVVESHALVFGFQVFFAERLETFVGDLRRAAPTLFMSVPRLWLKFQQGVFQKLPPARLQRLLKIPIVSWFVRRKVLKGLGLQHCRFAGSGSAPIPGELIAWYRQLGLELLEGYGMTENFAYSHCSVPGRARVGYVGEPYEAVEHRLSEEGEVQLKSPGLMLGYYRQPEVTAECFTADGWFRTGDRGEIDERNRLRITGRVKELFKTSKGKYVAPAPIENRLLAHPRIELACVTGSGHPQPYALVLPGEEQRRTLSDPALRTELERELAAHLDAVNGELDPHERLAFVAVVTEEWSIGNRLLTPTLKIKRSAIEDRYQPAEPAWYAAGRPVVWHEERLAVSPVPLLQSTHDDEKR